MCDSNEADEFLERLHPYPAATTLREAKRQLNLIWRRADFYENHSCHCYAVHILQRYPQIAAQRFFIHEGEELPLLILIKENVSLACIRAVCALHTDSWNTENLTFCEAIRLHDDDAVVDFLAQRYSRNFPMRPDIAFLRCALERTAHHGEPATLRRIQSLWKLCNPERLSQEDLENAINEGCSTEVIEFLLEHYSGTVDKLNLRNRLPIDITKARAIAKIPWKRPESKSLLFMSKLTCEEAFVHVLNSLAQSTCIFGCISIRISRLWFMEHNGPVETMIRKFLQNGCVRKFSITMYNEYNFGELDDKWFGRLGAWARNQTFSATLEHLDFWDLKLSETQGFIQLLTHGLAPKHLELRYFRSQGDWPRTVAPDELRLCRVQKLTLHCIKMNPVSLTSMLWYLSQLPLLTNLSVRYSNTKVDITEIVVGLLGRQRIQYLDLKGDLQLDTELFCSALSTNTSLQKLDANHCFGTAHQMALLIGALETANVTLQSLCRHVTKTDPTPPRLRYLLTLNELGRSRVRDENLHRAEFVELLIIGGSQGGHDITFGLLREAPARWCH